MVDDQAIEASELEDGELDEVGFNARRGNVSGEVGYSGGVLGFEAGEWTGGARGEDEVWFGGVVEEDVRNAVAESAGGTSEEDCW